MISWLLALLASSQVPYELLALVLCKKCVELPSPLKKIKTLNFCSGLNIYNRLGDRWSYITHLSEKKLKIITHLLQEK